MNEHQNFLAFHSDQRREGNIMPKGTSLSATAINLFFQRKTRADSELGFSIREFRIKDTKRILEIRRASLVDEFELFGSDRESFIGYALLYSLLRLAGRLTGKTTFRIFVGDICGDIVGITTLSQRGQSWEISGVMVDPKYRRRGYGRKLVSKALEEAKRQGAEKIHIRVLDKNIPARALYSALGFADFEKVAYFHGDWVDFSKQPFPAEYEAVELKDSALHKLFACIFRQRVAERFSILDFGESVGTLEFRAGSQGRVLVLALNLHADYRGRELEESLILNGFRLGHQKGANRLIVEVNQRDTELEEVCKGLNLKLLCIVRGMSRDLTDCC